MKTFKQIITVVALAIFMLNSFSINAQTLKIPSSVKSKINTLENDKVSTFSKFSQKYNAVISISYDENNKIVRINGPKKFIERMNEKGNNNSSKMAPHPVLDCYKDCMSGGGDSESGAWLCYWICVTAGI